MRLKNTRTAKCRKCRKEFTTDAPTRICNRCLKSSFGSTRRLKITKEKCLKQSTRYNNSLKKENIRKLKETLDGLFSLFIRRKYAIGDYVKCVTCGAMKLIPEMQNGHYISRSSSILRYSEDNCFPQCVSCNVFKHGNYPAYTEFLINKFGHNYVLNLVKVGRLEKRWTAQELNELIKKYKV